MVGWRDEKIKRTVHLSFIEIRRVSAMCFGNEQFLREAYRLESFLQEPCKVSLEKAKELARNGFYNFSTPDEGIFTCCFCPAELKNINNSSDIVKSHFDEFRICPIYDDDMFDNFELNTDLFYNDRKRYVKLQQDTKRKERKNELKVLKTVMEIRRKLKKEEKIEKIKKLKTFQ